eukprot:TRINITY_DN2748_c0_g1_i1.p1 TRINITY_DN2748_c0_g1~~TRINITY_DN2748_c0_g1_i1.p1  ORF type:complete len:392 (+),score=75.01 TRINITY_DN2748_c0_g1_i1:110-1177(+)
MKAPSRSAYFRWILGVYFLVAILIMWYQKKLEENVRCDVMEKYKQTGEILLLSWDPNLRGNWVDHPEYNTAICNLNCKITMDRDLRNEAASIFIHGSHHTKRGIFRDQPPENKCLGQSFALINNEPPHHFSIKNVDKKFTQKLDFLISYQSQSDIQTSYLDRFWKYYDPHKMNQIPPPRDKLVVLVVSNCAATLNKRLEYVKELMNYIKVDSYGKCLHNTDFPDDGGKLGVLNQYKFYLAFENSNYVDYVSEKVYDALITGAVPVYMGAPNIEEFVPQNSVIKTTDFHSPKDLADYLRMLDENEHEYNKYLSWRKEGLHQKFINLLNKTSDPFCEYCKKAKDHIEKTTYWSNDHY